MEDKSPNFGLKIKNFTNDDFNYKYTCACGLHSYTNKLDQDDGKYIYPPRILNYSNSQTEDRCNIDFVIEVYPVPKCFIVHERDEDHKMYNIVPKDGFPVNFTSVPEKHYFYNNSVSRMNKLLRTQQSIINTKNSSGNIYLTCTFDFFYQTVFRRNLTMCHGDHRDDNDTTNYGVNILFIVMAVIGSMVVSCVLGYLLYHVYVKYQKKAQKYVCVAV
ncbi:Hypothetical predicted protein [Mytilus galloprovincialis]|nr:Hypothetical predicted protein [Mytilus galloprovincialis]